MRSVKKLLSIGLVLAVAIVIAGAVLSAIHRPKPLKISVGVNDVYCKQTACSCVHDIANREYADFAALLKKRTGIELDLHYFIEPYDLQKAFAAGELDAFLCKPWPLVRQTAGRGKQLERIADLQDPDRNPYLWGIVIVPKNSPVQSLSDLKGRRIAVGREDAFEKHQGVQALLAEAGVAPAQVIEKASCIECLDLLLGGKVDAAAVSNYALSADCAVDIANPDDFRIVAETQKIPLTSFMVDTTRVSAGDAARLKEALVSISSSDLPASMRGGGFVAAMPWNAK